MPPRHTYWTIILEGKPTAFRTHTQEELLPTLRQLQSKHPDAVMKWFARGKLWHTPEEERMAFELKRAEQRTPKWRPGGEHRDPREQFKVPRDEKRRRFAAKMRRQDGPPRPEGSEPPARDPQGPQRPWRPKGPGGTGRPGRPERPWGDGQSGAPRPGGHAPGAPSRPGGSGRSPAGPSRQGAGSRRPDNSSRPGGGSRPPDRPSRPSRPFGGSNSRRPGGGTGNRGPGGPKKGGGR